MKPAPGIQKTLTQRGDWKNRILDDEHDYSACEARHRIVKIITITVITVIAIVSIIALTSDVSQPAKAMFVEQSGYDSLVSSEFAAFMVTHGHGKEFGIEDVQ